MFVQAIFHVFFIDSPKKMSRIECSVLRGLAYFARNYGAHQKILSLRNYFTGPLSLILVTYQLPLLRPHSVPHSIIFTRKIML